VTQHTYLECVKKLSLERKREREREREKEKERERGAVDLSDSNFRKSATGERKSLMLSRSKKVVSKSDVSCKDTKVTSEAICEALQGLNCCEVNPIYHPY